MKLEQKILTYLDNNDTGTSVDVTFIEDNYLALNQTLTELQGKNLLIIDKDSQRNFEAFGITNQRKKRVKAKINSNGKVYLHTLNKMNQKSENTTKRSWKTYLLNSF